MRGTAWRVAAASLLTGLVIGLPGVEPAAGETISSEIGPTLETVPGRGEARFDVPVPATRSSYQVAVASFSFDFAEPATR